MKTTPLQRLHPHRRAGQPNHPTTPTNAPQRTSTPTNIAPAQLNETTSPVKHGSQRRVQHRAIRLSTRTTPSSTHFKQQSTSTNQSKERQAEARRQPPNATSVAPTQPNATASPAMHCNRLAHPMHPIGPAREPANQPKRTKRPSTTASTLNHTYRPAKHDNPTGQQLNEQ